MVPLSFGLCLAEADNYNDEAINSALHRLSVRQQQRQYSAHKGAGILHNSGRWSPQKLRLATSGKSRAFFRATSNQLPIWKKENVIDVEICMKNVHQLIFAHLLIFR